MSDVVRLLVVVVVAAAAYVGWRRFRYPGGWAYAFSPEHSEARDDLDAARRHARTLERELKKERDAAQSQLDRERRLHKDRVRAIDRRISALRRPGRGGTIATLGEVTIHEHSVLAGTVEIPLAGLTVRLDHAQHQHFLYLTKPNGRSHVKKYLRTEYDEESVRQFVVRLENAVADENAFRIRTAADLQQAEEELAQVRDDTSAQDEAHARIAEVEERQSRDTRLDAARKEVQASCERWEHLTGKRPR
ncbi:hypothetical protein [Actinacidiphila rubida]|uniref:Uncharacterized protein n=1 Tax=Actinacidiphila rubida TaxID=310780 RepID=A0A1H8QMG2_9ACTN|nr:hypothetical protein [Actinacidiphila rubida]SEO55127.1 hypothetical protein SAMN05216267_103064 [Actinacidiphila rubida]